MAMYEWRGSRVPEWLLSIRPDGHPEGVCGSRTSLPRHHLWRPLLLLLMLVVVVVVLVLLLLLLLMLLMAGPTR